MSNIYGNQMTVTSAQNGIPVDSGVLDGFSTIEPWWEGDVTGTLTFTVANGKPLSGNNVVDLGSDDVVINLSDENGAPGKLARCKVTPNLSENASVTLYFR